MSGQRGGGEMRRCARVARLQSWATYVIIECSRGSLNQCFGTLTYSILRGCFCTPRPFFARPFFPHWRFFPRFVCGDASVGVRRTQS